jgi:hypothetical protein
MKDRNTNILEKIIPSIINIFLTFIISSPFLIYFGMNLSWKVIYIAIFFVYNLFFEYKYDRCLGMMILRTRYKNKRSNIQKTIYVFLYTLSFSTLLFYIWCPFDLLLINLLFLQLPSVLFFGTTLHGLVINTKTIKI